jgi:hypothetical protein
MRAAAEKMNLGPDAHYNPITGTFMRTNSLDSLNPFRIMQNKQNLASLGKPNTFFISKILANSPILDVAAL